MKNKSTLKICLVGLSLGNGGAEKSMALQSKMLHSFSQFEVHLVILTNKIDYEYRGYLFNLGKLKEESNSFISRLSRFKKLKNYFKTQQFDYIIDHRPKNNFLKECFYAYYLYKNIKRIYVVHSSKVKNYLTESTVLGVKLYNENVATVAVSKFIKEEILEKNGIKNVYKIFNTYDIEKINAAIKNEDLNEKKYILAYGRLVDHIKDYSFLIRAYQNSKLWQEDIFLIIMGDGEDKTKLQKLSDSLGLQEYITFRPFISNPFVMVKNSLLVTLTSRFEGFPMVIVESLASGIPVVSLDIKSGPSEVINHKENGLLVVDRNCEEFAKALRLLSLDKNLYNHCLKNTKPSIESFAEEIIADQWKNLLLKSC